MRLFKTIFLYAALFSVIGLPSAFAGAKPSPYSVNKISASLYYNNSGQFSQNVIDNPKFTFWNAIIGEGSAEGYSHQTLITIELSGPAEALPQRDKLRVQIKDAEKILVNTTAGLGIFNTKGHYYHIVALNETGCLPL